MTHDIARELELLHEATQRLVRTVDGLPDDDWDGPSLLPGWTRSHVVAHLALNSEALAGVLVGLVDDEEGQVPMYPSDEARNSDIEKAARAKPSELRSRLMGDSTRFVDAAGGLPEDAWSTVVERTPGGRTFVAATIVGMRLREVEIHHADLAAGYRHRDWTVEFSGLLLDAMAKRGPAAEPFRAAPTELDATWSFGEGGPDRLRDRRRPGLVADRPRGRRRTDQRQRRTAEDRGVVTLHRRGVAGRRRRHPRAVLPDRDQGRGGPEDVQQLLPAALQAHRRPGADRRRRRARHPAAPDRGRRAGHGRDHPHALGPPPRAGRRGLRDRRLRRGRHPRRRRGDQADRRARHPTGRGGRHRSPSATARSR